MISDMHASDHTFQDTEHGKMLLNPMGVQKKTLDQHLSERAVLGREIDTHARAARAVWEEEERVASGGAIARPSPQRPPPQQQTHRPATTGSSARQRPTEVDFLGARRARTMMGKRGRRASWLQPHIPRPPTTLAAQLAHYDKAMLRAKTIHRTANRRQQKQDASAKFGDFINANKQRVRDIFDRFDKDGDGTLSTAEFRQGLSDMGLPMTLEEVAHTLAKVNSDGDDTITFEELKGYLTDNTKRTRKRAEEAKRPPPVRVLTSEFWKHLGRGRDGAGGDEEDEAMLRSFYRKKPGRASAGVKA